MSKEIKSLTPHKPKSPSLWTMFSDGADSPSYSYTRIVGFIVIVTFMATTTYLSFLTGALVVPPKEWVYIIVSFSLMKPVQSFAESKDTESQLNYNFQMAQLTSGQPPTPTPKIEDKKVDIVPPVV